MIRVPRSALAVAALIAAAVSPMAMAPAASARPQHRGVTVHPLWVDGEEDIDRELDEAQRLKANVVRADVAWSVLEVSKGVYADWALSRLDRFMSGAERRGLDVIAVVVSTPCWASSAPADVKQDCSSGWAERGVASYPPHDTADYADVISYLVARYATSMTALEVWNEPNHPSFLTAADPPAEYTKLLRAAYGAAKAANPAVTVIAGALASNDRSFLESLYADGVKGFYDGISVHPYTAGSPATILDPVFTQWSFAQGLRWIRAAQATAGDSKPIWATELGWNTSTVRGGQPWENGVDPPTQARYLEQAFAILDDPKQGLGFVTGALAYNLRDTGADPAAPQQNFGLIEHDYTRKPAFAALQASFSGAPATVVAPPPVAAGPSGSDPSTTGTHGPRSARAYCRNASRKRVKGMKRSPFAGCLLAQARLRRGTTSSPRKACRGQLRRRVPGSRVTPFRVCVSAGQRYLRDRRASA